MTIHPIESEIHFKKSIMRFLIDELQTNEGVFLIFGFSTGAPRNDLNVLQDSWVCVSFGEKRADALMSAYVMFDIYTRKDNEGFESARIVDSITGVFSDENAIDGNARIMLYDTSVEGSWVISGGIMPIHRYTSGVMPGKEQTVLRTMTYEFKWGI